MNTIANKVELIRENKGISKKSVYDALGMTRQGYDKMIENDTISASNLKIIANLFNVSTSDFYDEIANKVSNNDLIHEKDMRIEELKSTIDFLKNLVSGSLGLISKDLELLKKYNFGMNDEKLGKYKELALGVGVFSKL